MNKNPITLQVNGNRVSRKVEARTHLADFLREDLLLTGTHLGCEQGVCGACTVMIDGRPARACITLAVTCEGAEVRTIESFDDDPLMTRLRDAFSRHHGLQCGFCTPGLLATAYDLCRRLPNADTARIRKELSGNLCRCTGYQGAVMAIADVLANDPPPASLQAKPRRQARASANIGTVPTAEQTTQPSTSTLSVPDDVADGVALTRRVSLNASPEQAWQTFQDIPAVVGCIPGGQLDGPVDGDIVRGHMTVRLGPMRAHFNGIARVELDEATKAGRLIGRGNDRISRSMLDGALNFKLLPQGTGGTDISLDMRYLLKGPLAQFGRPAVVEEIADRLLAETARNLDAVATGSRPSDDKPQALGAGALIWAALVGLVKSILGRR